MKLSPVLLILFMQIFVSNASAQNDKYKQVLLYNFLKYIDWPATYNPDTYEIAILGTASFYKDIKHSIETSNLLGRPVHVRKVQSAFAIPDCHILYISRNHSKYMVQIINQTKGKPILIVTEKQGLEKKGSDINFIVTDTEFEYILNRIKIEQKGLKINNRLIKYALAVTN